MTTFAFAIVGRAITLEREQRTDEKKDAKRIKSDNFTIAILEKRMIG